MKNPLISPLYYENHPIANRRLNEAFDCGFAAARRRLLMWNAAMAVLVLVLLGLVAGRRAHAQTSAPILTPQLNNDLFVGQIGYPTIQSAVSRACNMTGMGYRVVIPAGATPADTPAQVTGCAKVLVNDQRSAPSSNYSWNATTNAYQLQSATFAGGPVANPIVLPADPNAPMQASTKQYVDNRPGFTGGTVTTPITLPADPVAALQATTKQYVDAQSLANAKASNGCAYTFGDSWVQGTGSSTQNTPGPTSTAYAYGLLNDFGQITGNYGTGGDEFADTSAKVQGVVAPTQANNCVTIIGADAVNDVNVYAGDANRQAISRLALGGMIAQATVPDMAKAMAVNTSACARTGTWASDGPRIYSVTAGSTLTCTVTTYSTTLDYVYQIADSYGGSHTLAIDGGAAVTVLNQGPNGAQIATANGGHTTFALQQYATTAGVHTIVLTVGSGSLSEPVWLGGPGYPTRGPAPPIAFVSGGSPVVRGTQSQTDVTTYHTLVQTTVAAMAAQGHPVTYVPIDDLTSADFDGYTTANGYVCPVGTVQPYHPGNCGHAKIRHDFELAIRPVLRNSSSIAGITSGTIDGATIGASAPGPVGATHVTITAPAASSSNAGIDLLGTGINSSSLQCWTTGNGAGLAGVCGLLDNTTNTFLWSNNTLGDLFFGTPVSGGNVAGGVGSKFGFLHAGASAGPQIWTPGAVSVNSGTGVALPGGVWPETDKYFLFSVTPTSTVAAGSQFALFNFGKTWKNAAATTTQNPLCDGSPWNSPDNQVRQLITTSDTATGIGFGLAGTSMAAGTTYYFMVKCAGDLEQ